MQNFRKISGVYKITNLITGKFYIGSSIDVERRWKSHMVRYKSKHSKEFHKHLYEDMRKYGLSNFSFEIVCEEEDRILLRKKEKQIIQETNATTVGYNSSIKNQNHPNHKLTLQDVESIRRARSNGESMQSVFMQFENKISYHGFCKIWKYETWTDVSLNIKTIYTPNYSSPGDRNPKAKLTNDEVSFIRDQKKLGKSQKEVYELFSNRITSGSFRNIWHGYNWKSVT